MKLNEVIKNNASANIEVYEVKNNRGDMYHTDNLGDMIWDSEGDGTLSLSEVESREVIDYEVMDADRYNESVLANSGIYFNDIHEGKEEVMVILVKNS